MNLKIYHKNLAVSKIFRIFAPRNKKTTKNMKRFEMIRCIFDAVYNNGEEYSKGDAISSDCTRDGLVNRVYIKKLKIDVYACGSYVDNATITCSNSDYSDASDADLRIEFGVEVPTRTILWANEVSDKVLSIIVEKITK